MDDGWIASRLNGRCESCSPIDTPAQASTSISRPVGKNAPNIRADVQTIQQLLNDVPPDEGGPNPKLAVDGLCYGKTTAAIHKFQLTFMKWPDDRVDPGGKTHTRLTGTGSGPGGALPFLSKGSDTLPGNPYLVPLIIRLVPRIRIWIRDALFELDRAVPYVHGSPGGILGDTPQDRLRRLNLHYRLDASPTRVHDFQFVREHFQRMENALRVRPSHAETELMAIFVPNPVEAMEKDNVAYAYGSGYKFLLGPGPAPIDPRIKVTRDRIYLCGDVAHRQDWDLIGIMVHELAHFVSLFDRNQPLEIRDHAGYGRPEEQPMKSFGSFHRIRTAQCYRNFAFDCHFGF